MRRSFWIDRINAVGTAGLVNCDCTISTDLTPPVTRDFNLSGKADVLWRSTTPGQVHIWLMNGTGITSAASPGTVAMDWVIVGVGDFNGGGKADVLWRSTTSGLVYIWLMNSTTISSAGSLAAPARTGVIQ